MLKKLFKSEGGFTLVELLVTIAILGVLFGITTLTLTGIGSDAGTTVCSTELVVVQSAMDIYLAEDVTNSISVSGAAAPITGGGAEFATYLRQDTKGSYTWDAGGGNLAQTNCP